MSLQEFARERRQRPDIRRQALVLFSDRVDTASHARFEDVSELARALDVTIYTITMHDGQLSQVIARNTAVGRAMSERRALTFDRRRAGVFLPGKATELESVYDIHNLARSLVSERSCDAMCFCSLSA
jgi:hypothetical protein